MKVEFFADAIELGIDDAEEVYTISFTESDPAGGPAESYLILQRSVAGLDDPDLPEPYIEYADATNARFATSIASAELLPTYFHLIYKSDARVLARPMADGSTDIASELLIRFNADGPLLRRMKYALELVIGDGFGWKAVG